MSNDAPLNNVFQTLRRRGLTKDTASGNWKEELCSLKVCIFIKSVREPVGWGRETNFIWFGTSVQTMEHIFLPRELTVYNS
jgi:hypothetical protein